MLNDPEKQSENESIDIRSYFVRERNALLVRGQFSSLYTDYYLHLMQHQLRYEPDHDLLLKDALAAISLHMVSKPWKEAHAWTVNRPDIPLNLFVTGDSRRGNVVGRAFTEDVRTDNPLNLLHAQVTEDGIPTRRSSIEYEGANFFRLVEAFYRQSEQRPARYFDLGDEDYVMICAQPDCDMEWFDILDDEAVRTVDQVETLSLLETRKVRFECGCSVEKLFPMLSTLDDDAVDDLFAGEAFARADCPRCGAHFMVDREMLEAFRREAN